MSEKDVTVSELLAALAKHPPEAKITSHNDTTGKTVIYVEGCKADVLFQISTTKDGGPAFPMPGAFRRAGDVEITEPSLPGMSLRDYFAGQAIICALADTSLRGDEFQEVASVAYRLADAMLAERAKVKP